MNKKMNIYLSGMGGQGIGFLSKLLSEACLAAGYAVQGSDTHGLAQRGGVVSSHLRIGPAVLFPMVPKGGADLVVSLERLEALRAMTLMGRTGSACVYYDAVFHPMSVRTEQSRYPEESALTAYAEQKNIQLHKVYFAELTNPRLQNTVLLAEIAARKLIGSIDRELMLSVFRKFIPEVMLQLNIDTFENAYAKINSDAC